MSAGDPSSHDLFGDRADDYARTRPRYPEWLFDHLAGLTAARDAVWDCGAGSGQASHSLARRYRLVLATDTSLRQLARTERHERIRLAVAAAEVAPFRDRSVDLVVVSAALHWFDRPRFYAEVRRVTRPGGILAVWSYYHTRITPEVDRVLVRYIDEIVGPYWPPGIRLNRDAYRDLEFPFERLPWPEVFAEARMRLADLRAYVRTWSASQAWEREHGADPLGTIAGELGRAWGDPNEERLVRWPLHGAIGRL